MTRQKQVFPRDMVAHLWANRAQDGARDKGGSFYFSGPTVYSYGPHFAIGHWLDTPDGARLLWNDARYSNTTSTHQSHARGAVRGFDWQRAIRVPSLRRDSLPNGKHGAEALRHLANDCTRAAVSALEAAEKGRLGTRANDARISEARRYLDSARELYVLAKAPKAVAMLPALSADPTKDELRAILKAVNAAEHVARASAFLARADECMAQADKCAAGGQSDMMHSRGADSEYSGRNAWDAWGTQAQGIMHHVSACRSLVRDALRQFKLAGKKSTKAANLSRKCDALARQWEAQATADKIEGLQSHASGLADLLRGAFAKYRRPMRKRLADERERRRRGAGYSVPGLAEQIAEALRELDSLKPDTEPQAVADARAFLAHVDARLTCDKLTHILADVRNDLDTWRADNVSPPTMPRELSDMLRHGRQAPEFWQAQARDVAQRIADARAQWDREAAERNAHAIAAWRAGGAVRPTHEWPTMGRIHGETVQTSRGAVVPLVHACRLARIARRVMAQGGREWADGTGPTVGHFRVNAIRADGSAVIGCHEFNAEEGARILAELESCAMCKDSHDTDDS